MLHKPFTAAEAEEIADDFEDLIDTDFTINKTLIYYIESVLICPYNDEDKMLFISNYHYSKDQESALAFYTGNEFDVVVLAYDVDDETSFTNIDIRTFATQRGISYSFPE